MKFLFKFGLCLFALSSAEAKLRVGGVEVVNTDEHYLTYVRHMTVPFTSQNGAVWDTGNNVQGKTAAEIQVIVTAIKALETDTRQKEIHARMVATPNEWFVFSDIAHAKATVTQRLETVSMMDIFNSPNSRYKYGRVHDGVPYSTTAALWEKGSGTVFFFRQKGGTAYNAITQLCDGSSVTEGECLGAITACVWWGSSQVMEAEKFNQLYPGTQALNMDFRMSNSHSRNLQSALDSGESHHVPGDRMYLVNHNYNQVIDPRNREFYKKGWLLPEKKKTYYWSGENALYFGSGIYEGLGVEKNTTEEMRETLRQHYNNDLAEVIVNGGKVNGFLVTALQPRDAATKIIWRSVKRVKY